MRLADEIRWQDLAACATVDPEIFYPVQGGSAREARAVCVRCPVMKACGRYAVRTGQQFGIWGGTSERQRRGLKATVDEPGAAA